MGLEPQVGRWKWRVAGFTGGASRGGRVIHVKIGAWMLSRTVPLSLGLIHCGDLRSRCPTRQPVPGRPSGQTAQCEDQPGVAIAGELSRPMWFETGGGPKKDGKALLCFALFDTNKAQGKKAGLIREGFFCGGYVRSPSYLCLSERPMADMP